MNQATHRLGVSEATLVKRKLKLAPADTSNMDAAVSEIDDVFGLDAVSFDEHSKVLSLAYDASRTCLDCVEEILAKHHVTISQGLWMRFKQNFYHFIDDNVKENARKEPWNCH